MMQDGRGVFTSLQMCKTAMCQLPYENVLDSSDAYLNMSGKIPRKSIQQYIL